jgi:hypothetical protein
MLFFYFSYVRFLGYSRGPVVYTVDVSPKINQNCVSCAAAASLSKISQLCCCSTKSRQYFVRGRGGDLRFSYDVETPLPPAKKNLSACLKNLQII